MQPEPRPRTIEDALRTAAVAIALAVLVFLFLSRVFYKPWHIAREFEFDKLLLIALSAGLLGAALCARRLGARVLLVAVGALGAASVAVAGAVATSVDLAARLKSATEQVVYRKHTPDIYQHDDRYGYVLRPNARDVDRTFDYDVTYTIDASGRRVTPTPDARRATILIAGDSFTFGTGVEDRETYPYVLGARFWRDVKIVNAAAGGWGIVQAYLTVTDALARQPRPDAIIYAMIPDDQFRSHLRAPITRGVTQRLEFVDNELVMRRLADAAPAPAVTPELVEQELAMNRALIEKMHRACADEHVPFALVLLQDEGQYPPDLVYAFAQDGIPIVDLTRLKYERFPHDYHPNAADHRRIAGGIAASALSSIMSANRTGGAR